MSVKQSRPLQTASLNWVQDEDDNQWVITGEDKEVLGYLPSSLKDKDAMGILRTMRTQETNAYNSGKDDGSNAMQAVMRQMIVELDMKVMVLERQNKELAEALDRAIGG
jgi:hypothetical protein